MSDRETIRQRNLEAAHLQLIEGNPFDAEDIAMFEMFDREEFSPEQRRAYIIEQSRKRTAASAFNVPERLAVERISFMRRRLTAS